MAGWVLRRLAALDSFSTNLSSFQSYIRPSRGSSAERGRADRLSSLESGRWGLVKRWPHKDQGEEPIAAISIE